MKRMTMAFKYLCDIYLFVLEVFYHRNPQPVKQYINTWTKCGYENFNILNILFCLGSTFVFHLYLYCDHRAIEVLLLSS